ncbi:hypothetical protein KC640_02395 [Candidatus Dojkabacteria bacterium]|uniref:Heavy-metal-associated domain-containing protein n=1 Tax=Candidatus Dojkabacteria bacterium TaxID=2099670 RepID=A0A955I5B1_9BACT|nr:hypothetical protein [Candidatus Dojkabacteria bacterium]
MQNYPIKGATCNACQMVISMSLEEFPGVGVVASDNPDFTFSLQVPESLLAKLPEIKKIVDTAGHYELITA